MSYPLYRVVFSHLVTGLSCTIIIIVSFSAGRLSTAFVLTGLVGTAGMVILGCSVFEMWSGRLLYQKKTSLSLASGTVQFNEPLEPYKILIFGSQPFKRFTGIVRVETEDGDMIGEKVLKSYWWQFVAKRSGVAPIRFHVVPLKQSRDCKIQFRLAPAKFCDDAKINQKVAILIRGDPIKAIFVRSKNRSSSSP